MNSSCKKIYEALNRASSFLKEKGREEAAARILIQHVLGMDHTALLISLREEMDEEAYSRFFKLIEQHAEGIPIQHLTGTEQFYGRSFTVNEHVLIPRPETEELVDEALKLIASRLNKKTIAIADIGTGSGIIAITMKCELPDAFVAATDISEEALHVAERNAERLQAAVEFHHGHLAEPLASRKWDVILSNPPYIAYNEAESLADTVRDYEPHSALFADKDGLALYEEMAGMLPALMNRPGIIGFEIGHTQGQQVKELLAHAFPDAGVTVKKDINGKDRMVFCVIGE